jgi:hypothetical protein
MHQSAVPTVPSKKFARHSITNVRVGATPSVAVKMPSPDASVRMSFQCGRITGPKPTLAGKQTLL